MTAEFQFYAEQAYLAFVNKLLDIATLDIASEQRPIKKSPEKSSHLKGRSGASRYFERTYNKYATYKEHKAIAISIVSNERWGDRWIAGYSYEYPSQEEANERAIYECNRESRGRYRVSGCALYAIGDKVVQ